MSFSAIDHRCMARALQLARRGLCTTTPNPRVGCVLVKGGHIIGEGWHEQAGGPHAEIMALQTLGADEPTALQGGRAKNALLAVADGETARGLSGMARGATAYVTLEPCCHHGRTPPCTEALIDAGIERVVAAMQDPNPLVAGHGLQRLREAGIEVAVGLLAAEAAELNPGFISRMTRGRPWLRLKIAASLDGRTALANGVSQWITGPAARRDVHAWRARSCAVLVGSGTLRADNPRLTVREVAASRQPLKVVIDSRLDTSCDAAVLEGGGVLIASAAEYPEKAAKLVARGAEVIVLPNSAGRVDLPALMQELGRRGINEVLVEAGPTLSGALLAAGCVDELLIYQAPLLLGEAGRGMVALGELATLAAGHRLRIFERRAVGADLRLRARLDEA